jgi:alanine transaminase
VSLLLWLLISDAASGVLIPNPQYPLYSAVLAAHNGRAIPYYLDEGEGWSTSAGNVRAALERAGREGVEAKALVVINPGNPTGALLDEGTMERLVRVCEAHGLVLLADEVYQTNLHQPAVAPFTSFKKVVCRLGSPVPLVSFHSTSKGVIGECGRRGGYFELHNFLDEVVGVIYKMMPVGLTAPVQGQLGVDAMVRPPVEGEESYALWKAETEGIGGALAQRTGLMVSRLNRLRGVSCVDSPGALYLYPRITIPAKAVAEAQRRGKAPDVFYALELLDATGICVVPGSGFEVKGGDGEGEIRDEDGDGGVVGHYRLTCLCPGVEEYVAKLARFHEQFMEEYGP